MEDPLTISHRLDCAVHAAAEASCSCGEIDRLARVLVNLHWEGALVLEEDPEVSTDDVRRVLGLHTAETVH